MKKLFNHTRLKLARTRRQLTIKELASRVELTTRMVSEYEKDRCTSQPPESTILAFSHALNYPADFFFEEDEVDTIDVESVSFRSLKSMKASQQHAAISAGSLGVILNDFLASKFELFPVDIPDLSGTAPEIAAEILRSEWELGNKSISHVITIMEMHGVRVFALDENTTAVDAFSFWKDGVPFVFLNTKKSAERSRFDAAHELAHLILHRNEIPQGKDIEKEADKFASFFLMPRDTILSLNGGCHSIQDILTLKLSWKVSAMALIVQMKNVGVISEWQYKTLIIEASRMGLRTNEINSIPRESSQLIKNIVSTLKSQGTSVGDIARELKLPFDEVTSLLFMFGVVSAEKVRTSTKKGALQLIK